MFIYGAMYGHKCRGFCKPVHAQRPAKEATILLCNSHPIPLRQAPSLNLNLEFHWWSASPSNFSNSCLSLPRHGGYMDVWHNPAFPLDSEDLNLGPSVCIASALTFCFILPVSSNIKFLLLVLFPLSPKEGQQEQTARTSQPAPHSEREKEERRE